MKRVFPARIIPRHRIEKSSIRAWFYGFDVASFSTASPSLAVPLLGGRTPRRREEAEDPQAIGSVLRGIIVVGLREAFLAATGS